MQNVWYCLRCISKMMMTFYDYGDDTFDKADDDKTFLTVAGVSI